VESPFFDYIFADLPADSLTRRVALDLRTQGYAVLDFPDPEIGSIADRIKRNLNGHYEWRHWHQGVAGFNARVQDAWTFDADVKRIATNPQMIELLEELYGRRAFPFQTLNFCVGSQQHVHTDSVHFSANPERFMCGVWVALEDTDDDNGPLIYYPGSHAWPVYTNEHIGVNTAALNDPIEVYPRYETLWDALIEANGVKPQRFYAKKGQALIWAANLLHGGDAHHDRGRTRWSQVTHYYFEGCSYYTPMFSEPYFGRISFREPMDITSGALMKSVVSGLQTPDAFIAATALKPRAAPVAAPMAAAEPVVTADRGVTAEPVVAADPVVAAEPVVADAATSLAGSGLRRLLRRLGG
jgi:hypothetical protein